MYKLVLLLADSDFTFFNLDTDGIQKAVINKVTAQVYVKSDSNVGEFCERMLEHFGGYFVPSDYTGVIEYADGVEILPEFPENFSWDVIEKNYPNYHNAGEILKSDLLTRYIENELCEVDNKKDIDEIEIGCPEYLTHMEWALHLSADLDIDIFNYSVEKKNE